MKLDFIADGSPDCPLIRLYKFQPSEIETLCRACRNLAAGRITEFALHEEWGIELVGGCRFIWRAHRTDVGVLMPARGSEFVLLYSDEAWREVEGKLMPFAHDACADSYNWLTMEGEVRVLVSPDGTW